MTKFILGCFTGSVISIVLLVLLSGLMFSPAQQDLIEKWRKIEPGMKRVEVKKLLGQSSYDMLVGSGFPEWARQSVPEDYYENHGLIVFTVGGIGPQLLLVYYDSENRVTFVSSIHT